MKNVLIIIVAVLIAVFAVPAALFGIKVAMNEGHILPTKIEKPNPTK